MAHTVENILSLLPLLDEQTADDLETEALDFKECPTETKLRELGKEMAICLGNASCGTVGRLPSLLVRPRRRGSLAFTGKRLIRN